MGVADGTYTFSCGLSQQGALAGSVDPAVMFDGACEVDLGKVVALRLARVPEVFQERAAREHGLDAVLAAIGALEAAAKPVAKRGSGAQRGGLPLKAPK